MLILVLGLRRGEALGLGWDEVDIDAGELRVAWQLQRVGGHLLRRETKTESSRRPAAAARDLHYSAQGTARAPGRVARRRRTRLARSGLRDQHPLRATGQPRNFHRDFKARCAKAGVRAISVHSTRRTCASLLVALDVHPRVAMQVLRHSQIAITMNVYSEVGSAETRTALRRLGEQLQGG